MLPVVQKMQKQAGVGASLDAMLGLRETAQATCLASLCGALKMKILNP